MAYVLVTILEPGQRDLDNRAPAELNRHFWNMRDIIADFPTLPEPPHPEHQPGPMATGLFAPDVQLRYRLDGNMIQHALDGTLWQMQNKEIICTASDIHGKLLRNSMAERPVDLFTVASPETANRDLSALLWPDNAAETAIDLFTYSWNLVAWKLWGDLRIFRPPASTDELGIGPIWDCSDEASTSGTKDEPPPNEELRRRRRKLFYYYL